MLSIKWVELTLKMIYPVASRFITLEKIPASGEGYSMEETEIEK